MIKFIFHARIVLSGNFNTCVVCEQHRVPSTPLWTSSLINDGYGFLTIDMSCRLIMRSYHWENDMMDRPKLSGAIRSCHRVHLCEAFLMSNIVFLRP